MQKLCLLQLLPVCVKIQNVKLWLLAIVLQQKRNNKELGIELMQLSNTWLKRRYQWRSLYWQIGQEGGDCNTVDFRAATEADTGLPTTVPDPNLGRGK